MDTTSNALALIISVILILWGIATFLRQRELKINPEDMLAEDNTTSKPQDSGLELTVGLHITGVNADTVKLIRSYIHDKSRDKLQLFLLKLRPGFPELQEYLQGVKSQYLSMLEKPLEEASEADKVYAANQLDLTCNLPCLDLDQLSRRELRTLLEHYLDTEAVITGKFIEHFGGDHFYANFKTYSQLALDDQPQSIHITEQHQHRQLMETLVANGVVIQGRKIPLEQRLQVLSLQQLQQIAKDLLVQEDFTDKAQLAEHLKGVPGVSVHLSMLLNMDDIFLINSEIYDSQTIDREWEAYEVLSKLLCDAFTDLGSKEVA